MKTINIICPVYGLGWKATDIQIDKVTTLRFIDTFNDEEKTIAQAGLPPIKYKCLLEIRYKYNPNDAIEPIPGVEINIINKIEAALRSFHEGKIGIAALISENFTLIRSQFIPNGREDYKIDKNKLGQFPAFYKEFITAYEQKPVAFDYYSRAQVKHINNDRTVDWRVALESLFVPDGSRSAKKIFITHGMQILGFTSDEIEKVADLYKYRNVIVHGTKQERIDIFKKNRGKYTSAFFENCEGIIRIILQKYVNKPW